MPPADDPLAALASIRESARAADGLDPLDEATTLRLRHRGLTAGDRLLLAPDEGGFGLLIDDEVHLVVAPDHRRRGVGTDLLNRLLDSPPAPRGVLQAWSHGDHPAARRLAARAGFVAARELWVMRRDMAQPVPRLPAHDGLTITSFHPREREALLRVNAAAFASHPEQGAMDAVDLAQRMAEPWYDPAGLLLVHDPAGRLLGFHWTKRHDADTGEVYVVGVAPEAQGRGLGRLLTLAGLHHLAVRGVREVLLYVEADNAAAVGLYSALGFTHAAADTHVRYRRGAGPA
ncbi:MAG: mycothiol synthase [Nocardioides sp.]